MKILMPCAYYEPEKYASAHLVDNLEEALVRAGYSVDIVTPVPTRGLDDEQYRRYKSIKHEEKYGGKINVLRFGIFREGKNSLFRALRYFLSILLQYFKCRRIKDADLIFCMSTPPILGLLCARLKKKLKIPFIYNLQDVFPDSLVNTGMTREGSMLWKIGRRVEDSTYKACDRIVVISEAFKRNIMEKGVPEEKITVIPNWVDENAVKPILREDNPLFDKYGLDRSKFYVSYCGNIGYTQNMDLLIDTAKEFKDNDDIRFVLIGEGAYKENVERRIHDEGIDNIILLPFQPYEYISYVFSLADAGLIISKAGVGTNSVPSKTWSIMSAQRPIIASFDTDSELSDIISSAECGICVTPDDKHALYDAVNRMYSESDIARYGENGRDYILSNLTREAGTEKWVNTINNEMDVKVYA